MLVKTFGSAIFGVNAMMITVEVSVDPGVNFTMVGLPDNAVKESQQRIATAVAQHGFHIPGKRIVVNLAPADVRKEGAAYDLAIAIGILGASGQMRADDLDKYVIMGELSLDGSLRPNCGFIVYHSHLLPYSIAVLIPLVIRLAPISANWSMSASMPLRIHEEMTVRMAPAQYWLE